MSMFENDMIRSQKTEDRRQKTEDRRQKTEDRRLEHWNNGTIEQ